MTFPPGTKYAVFLNRSNKEILAFSESHPGCYIIPIINDNDRNCYDVFTKPVSPFILEHFWVNHVPLDILIPELIKLSGFGPDSVCIANDFGGHVDAGAASAVGSSLYRIDAIALAARIADKIMANYNVYGFYWLGIQEDDCVYRGRIIPDIYALIRNEMDNANQPGSSIMLPPSP